MRIGIVRFPGSNCEMDCYEAAVYALGQEAIHLWHKEHDLQGAECIILPGGFSYGDYLRAGAMASLSPIIKEVVAFAKAGRPVLGICNGFQILTECGLLPGALVRNIDLRFVCGPQHLFVSNNKTIFSSGYNSGQVVNIPIAHGEGNYRIGPEQAEELFADGQVVFQYCDQAGNVNNEVSPNGSVRNIAGVVNAQGNVLGMMPHPERVCDPLLGGEDGFPLFRSLLENINVG